MPEENSATSVGKELPETAIQRLSERLGDPFLFSFVTAFIIFGWRFFFALLHVPKIGALKDLTSAVNRVSEYLDDWVFWKAFSVGLFFAFVWPWLGGAQRLYLAWKERLVGDWEQSIRSNKTITLAALREHPEFVALQGEHQALVAFAARTAGCVIDESTVYLVAYAPPEGVQKFSFVEVIRGSELATTRRVKLGPQRSSNAEVGFVVDSIKGPTGRSMVILALKSMQFRWPDNVEFAPMTSGPKGDGLAGVGQHSWDIPRIEPVSDHPQRIGKLVTT
ncbi:MAG: hypothetical protein QM778_00665 [Myxococcales bacterium]